MVKKLYFVLVVISQFITQLSYSSVIHSEHAAVREKSSQVFFIFVLFIYLFFANIFLITLGYSSKLRRFYFL